MPNPIDNEELYDSIELAGVRSPGFVTLSGHDRVEKWDVKSADGAGGARMTYKGDEIAQFQASFYLVKDPVLDLDEFAAWEKFAAVIKSSIIATGKPKALKIYHPDLAANDIKSVCKASIGGMQHDGKGGATVVVKFIEYRPQKPASGVPVSAKQTKPDPNADLKAIVKSLTDEAMRP
jgi:hypothetical protein